MDDSQSITTDNHIVFGGELVGTISVQLAVQELSSSQIYQSFAHAPHQDLLLSAHQPIPFLPHLIEHTLPQLIEPMRLRSPTRHTEEDLDFLGSQPFPFEELRVQICMVPAEMMTARSEDAPLSIALQKSSHRNVERLTTHMLADADKFQLTDLLFDCFWVCLEPALLDCCMSHGCRQHFKIKIRNVSLVSLKVWVVSKEFIELIPASLSFKKYIFAMCLEFFLDFYCNCIGQHSFSRSKLNIDELWRNEFILKGFLCNQSRLKMIICSFFNLLARSTLYKMKELLFLHMILIHFQYFLYHFIHRII